MPLNDTFNMSPDKAMEWFNNKGLVESWNWYDLWEEQHATAFTVAKSMQYDILSDIRDAIKQAQGQGLTKRQFRQLLSKKLKAKGWWGRQTVINPKTGKPQIVQLGSAWRLNTIYKTNMQAAMMAGRWRQFKENSKDRPYLQYVAVMDSSTRPSHAALNGRIFHIDDPIWREIWPPNGFNCFSDDTEVFTKRGWVLFSELKGSDVFLSQNKDSKYAEWVKPKSFIKQHFKGSMVNFKSRTMDVLVTPNHDMLVMTDWESKNKNRLQFKQAKDVAKSSFFPRTSKWKGSGKKTVTVSGIEFNAKQFCRFLAYYLADGSCTDRGNGRYEAKITQSDKQQYIIDSLPNFPVELTKRKHAVGIVASKEFKKWLHSLGVSATKNIPEFIQELSPDCLDEFIQGYLDTDGCRQKPSIHSLSGNITKGSELIFTSSDAMANGLSLIAQKCGYAPSFAVQKTKGKSHKFKNGTYTINNDLHVITLTKKPLAYAGKKSIVDYDGMVYCVELEKNNTLWVRRNGKAVWSGNCRCRVRALTAKQAKARGFKEGQSSNLPDGFPDLGFSHNHGIAVSNKFYDSARRYGGAVTKSLDEHITNPIIADQFKQTVEMVLSGSVTQDTLLAGFIAPALLARLNSKSGVIGINTKTINKSKVAPVDLTNLSQLMAKPKALLIDGDRLIYILNKDDRLIEVIVKGGSVKSVNYIDNLIDYGRYELLKGSL